MTAFILLNPLFLIWTGFVVAVSDIVLQVGGITPFTTIDFPGRLAAVIFCQGCPWRCQYCHNRHLLPAGENGKYPWEEVLRWLGTRRGLLEGVVFSGGEPLLQRQLPEAVEQLHRDGFEVALHTSGVYPERLRKILPSVEWVGLDIKAPFDEYDVITGGGNGERVRHSLGFVLASGKAHELRCTLDPDFFNIERAEKMARQLVEMGADHLVLQSCRDEVHRRKRPVSKEIIALFERFLPSVTCRL